MISISMIRSETNPAFLYHMKNGRFAGTLARYLRNPVTRFPERAVGKYPERNNARILKSNKAVLCMRRVQDRSREKVLHNL